MSGVEISRCADCAWQGTPRRLWCPACGGEQIESVVVTAGVVAEVTTVRRIAGGEHALRSRSRASPSTAAGR